MASIAFVLHAFANKLENTRKLLRYPPGAFIPVGLAIALLSGLAPVLAGKPFLTALWFTSPIPIIGLVGTPIFFDIGVFFVVIGITLTILFTISENIL